MNTSMPTTSNDLTALLAGGAPAGTTSPSKGMFAGLTHSRSAQAESGSGTGSDFQSMLNAPATLADGTAKSKPTKFGQPLPGDLAGLPDQGNGVLSVASGAVATATLQIKGMVSGSGQTVTVALQPLSEKNIDGVVLQSSRGMRASALASSSQGVSGVAVSLNETAATEIASVGQTNESPLMSARLSAVGSKPASGLGRFQPAGGLLATAARSMASKGKTISAAGTKADASVSVPEKEAAPARDLSLPALTGIVVPVPTTPATTPTPVLNTGNILDVTIADPNSAAATPAGTTLGEAVVIPSISIPNTPGLPATDQTVPASVGTTADPVKTSGSLATSVQTPTKGPRFHGLLNQPQTQNSARAGNSLLSAEKIQAVVEIPPSDPAEQTAPATTINPDQRREVIETVVALLAPLWAALPKMSPQTAPVSSNGTTDQGIPLSGSGDGEKALNTAVTIKLGNQPSFTIELSLPDAALSEANASLLPSRPTTPDGSTESAGGQIQVPASAVSQAESAVQGEAGVTILDQDLLQPAALDAALPGQLPLDFRIQLKTKIEAALAKANPLPGMIAPKVTAVAGKAVVKDAPSELNPTNGQPGVAVAVTNNAESISTNSENIGLSDQDSASVADPTRPQVPLNEPDDTPLPGLKPSVEIKADLPAVSTEVQPQSVTTAAIPAAPGELLQQSLGIKNDIPATSDGLQPETPVINEAISATAAEFGQQSPQSAPKGETPATPVEVRIEVPGFGSLTAEIVASQPGANSWEKKPGDRSGRAEKTAGDFKSAGAVAKGKNILPEKTFLSAAGQELKPKSSEAGTDVAVSGDNMPALFTSRRLTVDPLELPPRFNDRGDLLPTLNETPKFAASTNASDSATPAPVLAHRAVETIMNVVEAQRNGSANASSVNLHFKFGGDDLAVRVQMRGGEVLTQFLTDSAELRSAISSEWQIMAGQGGAAGLRLLEPTIMPTSSGVSAGFGSASQGQNHAQQNAQQQQARAAGMMPELRELRRNIPLVVPNTDAAVSSPVVQPNSRLLAATA